VERIAGACVRKLRALDVCCGAGGWAIAARGLPIEIVEAVDMAEDCLETYRYNHPETKATRMDVTELKWKRFEGINLVLGGIPCEQVSPARRGLFRKPKPGTLEKWHALIDSVLDGIKLVNPEFWALENVIQMRRHLPPLTPFWIVNAANYCGQSRKRMFAGKFPTPLRGVDESTLSDYLRPGPYVIPSHVVGMECRPQGQHLGFEHRIGRLLNPRLKSPTVIKYTKRLQDVSIELPGGRRRVMQFTEAAVLQGFPDDYVFVATQDRAWKMVAQAIPIPVGRAILEAICRKAAEVAA
jgi:site-specific DNA-cytosine methylase